MKKYLITGLAAVAISGMFTSCTHETDAGAGGTNLGVVETYEQAFISRFGTPSADADWGFGSGATTSRAGTRAEKFGFSLPTNPTFKDKNKIEEPTISGVYDTVSDAANAGVTVTDATNKQNFNVESNKSYAIDSKSSLNNLGNIQNSVIYITEDMTFNMSLNQNASNTVVITKGKTVTVNSVNQYQTYYVADGATLNFAYDISVERGFHLFMGSRSTVNTQNITIKGVNPASSIRNNGGTLNIGTEQNKKTLTLENGVTLWNEGTVNVYQELKIVNNNSAIYNAPGHTITIPSLTINNNNNLVVNDGTFIINGAIELSTVNAEVVNNGELTGTSLTLKAGGKFHNTGETTITGKTTIDNNNNVGGEWKNEGTFITEDFEIMAYCQKVWNCCKMIVHKANDTGVFKIYGEFVLDRGASITTDNVDWVNKSNVYMNGLSLFKVKETFDSDNKDTDCGIHAMADEWAVLKAKSIVQRNNTNDQFRMAYYGNLWVDAGTHFDLWYKDAPSNTNQPNYKFFGNAKFGHEGDEGCPVIPIVNAEGKNYSCTPGYNTTGGGGDEPGGGDDDTTPSIRVIAEDMGDQSLNENSDFDFNDVVFDVTWVSNSEVDVEILAAGGTLPLTVGWDGVDESKYRDFEVHNLLGYSETMIINTHSSVGNHIDGVPSKHLTLNGTFSKDDFAADVNTQIPIKVKKNGVWYDIKAEKKKAAAKLAVDKEYEPWCNERKDIDFWWMNADQQGLFSKYTQDPTTLTKFWYKQATHRYGELISK